MKNNPMHIKFENFNTETPTKSYDEFLMDLNGYLVKKGASQSEADECVYYYHAHGQLKNCWKKGLTLLKAVNSLKDDEGKIKWFK